MRAQISQVIAISARDMGFESLRRDKLNRDLVFSDKLIDPMLSPLHIKAKEVHRSYGIILIQSMKNIKITSASERLEFTEADS